ncbi:MAG: hypothetical protein R3E91_02020 [Chlamydiales bacterium]
MDFFQIRANCLYGKTISKQHLLPNLSQIYGLSFFADLYMGWSEEGISIEVEMTERFNQPKFPDFKIADSIELFYDTRDIKTTGYNTRFCHHFYFLPEPVENNGSWVQAGEITKFRNEDKHELSDQDNLKIKKIKNGQFRIFIPSKSLYGYDPLQFPRLGFTYRINRLNNDSQCFSADDRHFMIEQQPSLWASLRLVK